MDLLHQLPTSIAAVVVSAVIAGDVNAADTNAALCGEPPPVANESLKADIAARAQTLEQYFDGAQLAGKVETSRTEIFSHYPDAELSRSNAYFEYQVCILIMSDSTRSAADRLRTLTEVRREFGKPVVQVDSIEVINKVIDAARRGDLQGVTSIVDSGALGATGLQNALGASINAGRENLVSYLLGKGALPDQFDYIFAATGGHISVLKLLLRFDSSHIPPELLYATTDAVLKEGLQLNVLEFVGTLQGIQPNYKELGAGTSLSMASRAGRSDVVAVLLHVPGMSVSAPGDLGDNPVDEACQNGHWDVVRQLAQSGGKPRRPMNIQCFKDATGRQLPLRDLAK